MAKLMPPSSSEDSGWVFLTVDILNSVFNRLVSISDYARVSAVCRHWRASLSDHLRPSRRRPVLLVPTPDGSAQTRCLYTLAAATDPADFRSIRVSVPPPYNGRCCGSSHGWLAVACKIDGTLAVTLYNPFTGASIRLPEIALTLEEKYFDKKFEIKKVVLSADPASSSADFEAVAIYGDMRRLALFRSGDEDWIYVSKKVKFSTFRMRRNGKRVIRFLRGPPSCSDVIHYKGQFYAVNCWGLLVSMRVSVLTKPYLRLKTIAPEENRASVRTYIVESSAGDLLLARRFKKRKDFKVFKLMDSSGKVFLEKRERKKEVRSLGGDALFLGDNHSMAVPAGGITGFRPNCVYFTDDCIDVPPPYTDGPTEMGVSNLKDGTVVDHYLPDPSHKHLPPPIWILPTFIENLL